MNTNGSGTMKRMSTGLASSALGLTLVAGVTLSLSSMPGVGPAPALASMSVSAAGDRILMRDGRTIEGTIVEETADYVSIKILAAGIQSGVATRLNMSDILRIDRAAPAGDPAPEPSQAQPGGPTGRPSDTEPTVDPNATRVYHMRLTGEFAKDISQTPIRQAVEDAAQKQAQIIIVEIDNEWRADQFSEKAEDEHAFDEFWRADVMADVFTQELTNLFPRGQRPRVVFWVKNAMGGAAFLPFLSPEIYFHPQGRMGGIGDLDTYFEGTNEWFADKQESLRLGEARGIALQGGYDSRLIDAMVLREYVLSVSFASGRPEYYEGPPNPGDTLLTDNGEGENEDTDADVVRARGNDNLTLHAPVAQNLAIADGQAETIGDLLDRLNVGRSHVMVSERADRIMDDWAEGIDQAIRTVERVWQQELPEARNAEGGGEWEERNAARGRQKALIEQLIRLLNKYEEVLDPGRQNRTTLELELEAIRLRTIQDRRR